MLKYNKFERYFSIEYAVNPSSFRGLLNFIQQKQIVPSELPPMVPQKVITGQYKNFWSK